MTPAEKAIRAALAAGPTPGPWEDSYNPEYGDWHVFVPLSGVEAKLDLFLDGCPSERPHVDTKFIAACNPTNLRALLDELDRLRADAVRLDWLAERLEDVQVGDADPTMHYLEDEEDVAWPVLWRRAIDAARKE